MQNPAALLAASSPSIVNVFRSLNDARKKASEIKLNKLQLVCARIVFLFFSFSCRSVSQPIFVVNEDVHVMSCSSALNKRRNDVTKIKIENKKKSAKMCEEMLRNQ